MDFDKASFIGSILGDRRRKVIPIMTSPGAALAGIPLREAFGDGTRAFACIRALAEAVPADAQVTFMDLSVEAEAFGAAIAFSDHENPTIARPLVGDAAAIDRLAVPAVGTKRTAETLECARLCARHLARPTFGGLIGPFSLAGRLAGLSELMIMAATEPGTAHRLLAKTARFLGEYLRAIKATGVAGALIAEPAAGLLSPPMCREFSADYLRGIIDGARDDHFMVILHNCGKTGKQVGELLGAGSDALHVGNAVDIRTILDQIPPAIPLMGNLDPSGILLSADSRTVYDRTTALLEATQAYPNHVLSSGCDLPPGVPWDNVQAFFAAAADYNRRPLP